MPRARTPHLRDSPVTIAATALGDRGLSLYCLACHHEAAWSPVELAAAEPPGRSLWDFKRRRRCSRCGAGGSTDTIYLTCSVMSAGMAAHRRPPNPTPPQLWTP